MLKIAVLGGGNGAFAAASHLGLKENYVKMYSPFKEEIASVAKEGGIKLKGYLGDHFVSGIEVCDKLSDAVKGADIVMIVVPANYHAHYAKLISPLLEDGQIVFLNPGHTGGALEVKKVFKENGLKAEIKLLETNTLTYVARKTGYNEVTIYKMNKIIYSTLPAIDITSVSEKIKILYPELSVAASVLETSLANFNAIMHPPVMILNAAGIERTKGDFYFYFDGTTPAVGKVMEALDKERLTILNSLNIKSISFLEFFIQATGSTKEAIESGLFYRIVKESPANLKIRAPENLTHRFLDEDIPCGLVPMAAIGKLYNVDTPIMDSMIVLANLINDKNYWEEGLNLKKLGIDNMSPEKVEKYIKRG